MNIFGRLAGFHCLVDVFRRKAIYKFEKIAVPAGFEKLFAAHAQLLRVLTEKCDIGIRIKTAYDAGDREALAALASRLDTLACDMRSFCGLRAAVWYENNKPFGFEVLLSNLSAVIGLTENAAVRIRAYLDGEVPSLPELEAERLTYSAKGTPFVMETTPASIMIP